MTATALTHHIARLIEETGPIPLSHYMALALGHPEHGYYMTRDPLGAKGDFITAPEISQMFGELIGLWLAEQWLQQGAPKPFALAELGPGRGTLMSDLLRAIRSVPGMDDAAEVHFVETSPSLREEQKARVPNATWHERIDTLPQLPLFLVANEFFDALPVTQYQRTERGWCERYVGLEGERFVPVLAPVPLASDALLPAAMQNAAEGEIAEISPASTAIAEEIASRVTSRQGAALFIDYGHPRSAPGDTLQAMRNHAYADPFDAPGTADITTHVDFEMLSRAVEAGGAEAHGPVEQGAFLIALGIEGRREALMRNATLSQRTDIAKAAQRLTAPDEMGSLFKVLGITPRGSILPAGFA
ncbi:class I SAM-dependent methyltransferase [Parvibaculum sp.]|jgi:NADH dehydrogenase [ubiquinone] 1 alpha subcomplex assembly factor 7|uniref:class I SAM-dependent methyltransferase n=1 Tax=Parvibaculum sp. TaxID=2024848 RepID=UPI000C5BDF51|nr:class I SAM-dependent methyltransferase [Parvibaculum sp.]MAM94291.1 methyltransferase [Parvibaculum sp.]HCX67820.1 methyltransferase [Rhodobiaceae bacterium]|tara:strand:- start:11119 stop:12195 length:1077 start_codon:yes stop_codon:yes gene_type:complete